jgi:hypothetical protein
MYTDKLAAQSLTEFRLVDSECTETFRYLCWTPWNTHSTLALTAVLRQRGRNGR